MERLAWGNLSLIRWIATSERRGGAARARGVLGLLWAQAGVLTLAGIALGVVLLYAALLLLQPYVDATYRLHLPIEPQAGATGDARRRRYRRPCCWAAG